MLSFQPGVFPWNVAVSPLPSNLGHRAYSLARVYRSFFGHLTARIHPRIFPEQWIILNQLSVGRAHSQTSLLSPYSEGMAGLTRTLSLMERRGWIKRKRKPGDKRVMTINLTAKGRLVHKEIVQSSAKLRPVIFAGITSADQAGVLSVLNQLETNLIAAIEKLREPPEIRKAEKT